MTILFAIGLPNCEYQRIFLNTRWVWIWIKVARTFVGLPAERPCHLSRSCSILSLISIWLRQSFSLRWMMPTHRIVSCARNWEPWMRKIWKRSEHSLVGLTSKTEYQNWKILTWTLMAVQVFSFHQKRSEWMRSRYRRFRSKGFGDAAPTSKFAKIAPEVKSRKWVNLYRFTLLANLFVHNYHLESIVFSQ